MIIVFLSLCYFIGAIPSGYLLVKKLKNIDIRTVGSGNVGATNAARVLGKWGFFAVFACDMLKGFVSALIGWWILGADGACLGGVMSKYYPSYVLIAAVLVMLGHIYTVFLNFKGGKGVATGVGIFMALAPVPLAIAAAAFGVVLYLSRMVSLSSITAATVLAVSVLLIHTTILMKVFTVLIAAFVIFKHRSNIKRIMNGEESRVEFKHH